MKSFSISNIAVFVSQECGQEACDKMINAYGGMRISIPLYVRGKHLEALGADVLKVLVRYFGGTELNIPSRGGVERAIRAYRLKNDIVSSSKSANALAAEYGVTASYVHKLRSKLRDDAGGKTSQLKA